MTKHLTELLSNPNKAALLLFSALFVLFSTVLCVHAASHKGDLIDSDGRGYFIHLPGLIVDHDLDDRNNRERFHMNGPNHWPVGTAVAWSPFYLVGHAAGLALGAKGSLEGNGIPEQLACCLSSIAYGSGAVALTFLFVCRWFEPIPSLLATLGLLGGSNLAYYMIGEPYMSHSVAAFWVSALLYLGIQNNPLTYSRALALGVLAGLAALTRPQAGLFLVLLIVWHLTDGPSLVDSARRSRWPLMFAGLVSLTVAYPQVLLWRRLIWNSEPNTELLGMDRGADLLSVVPGAPQQWLTPKIGWALLSPYCGLWSWHPITLLAVLGLILRLRSNLRMSSVCLLGFALQLYVVAAWWGQGQTYGARMMCCSFAVLAPGLATWFQKAPRLTTAITVCLGLLNLFAMLRYRQLIGQGLNPSSFFRLFQP